MIDHAIDALRYPFVEGLYAIGQKVRVRVGLEQGMVFTVDSRDGEYYGVRHRQGSWPWRFRQSELEPFVSFRKRLWQAARWSRLWRVLRPLVYGLIVGFAIVGVVFYTFSF